VVFTHDTTVALEAAVELVNTVGLREDTLTTVEELDAFTRRWSYTGVMTGDDAELEAVRALRPRLRRLWSGDRDEVVETVNELLREGRALPQLVRHDDWDYHLHATPPDAELWRRMAVEAALAVADVIRADEFDRLRTCAADDCEDVVVDLSRNRSKRFCDVTCANRTNVAAYRARRAKS